MPRRRERLEVWLTTLDLQGRQFRRFVSANECMYTDGMGTHLLTC